MSVTRLMRYLLNFNAEAELKEFQKYVLIHVYVKFLSLLTSTLLESKSMPSSIDFFFSFFFFWEEGGGGGLGLNNVVISCSDLV